MLEMYREEMYLLPYLSPNQVEDVFALEMHEHAYELGISPAFLDYLTSTYIDSDTAMFPPRMCAQFPDMDF